MKPIFVAIGMLFIIAAATIVQGADFLYQGQGVGVNSGIEFGVLSNRGRLDLGESWSGSRTVTKPRLSLAYRQGAWQARYELMPSWSVDDTFMPILDFRVGEISFGNNNKNDSASQYPVTLNWHIAPSHYLELSTARGELRPVLAGRWLQASVDASSKDKDGNPLHASQTWKAFLWSAGATYHMNQGQIVYELTGLAGPKYSRTEAVAMWPIGQGWLITGGYLYEECRVDELKMRNQGPWLGLWREW